MLRIKWLSYSYPVVIIIIYLLLLMIAFILESTKFRIYFNKNYPKECYEEFYEKTLLTFSHYIARWGKIFKGGSMFSSSFPPGNDAFLRDYGIRLSNLLRFYLMSLPISFLYGVLVLSI